MKKFFFILLIMISMMFFAVSCSNDKKSDLTDDANADTEESDSEAGADSDDSSDTGLDGLDDEGDNKGGEENTGDDELTTDEEVSDGSEQADGEETDDGENSDDAETTDGSEPANDDETNNGNNGSTDPCEPNKCLNDEHSDGICTPYPSEAELYSCGCAADASGNEYMWYSGKCYKVVSKNKCQLLAEIALETFPVPVWTGTVLEFVCHCFADFCLATWEPEP